MPLFLVYDGKRYGYADETGRVAIAPRFTRLPGLGAERFVDGVAIAFDKKAGFIDEAGEWIVPPRWDGAFGFREGRAVVSRYTKKRGFSWYATRDGTLIGPERGWAHASAFGDGRGVVQDEPYGPSYLVDERGEPVGPRRGVGGGPFREGRAPMRDAASGLFGYVDATGDWVIEPRYREVTRFQDGAACVMVGDGHLSYIDRDGGEMFAWDVPYLELAPFSEGLARVYFGDAGKGYVDATGATVIAPRPEAWGNFACGRAVHRLRSGFCGFIDRAGEVVIEPRYLVAHDFVDGLARVVPDPKKPGRFGYVDPSGELVIPPV
ncbi:MAG: WG repeat-containing protein [Sandaracinaceae bacterium]